MGRPFLFLLYIRISAEKGDKKFGVILSPFIYSFITPIWSFSRHTNPDYASDTSPPKLQPSLDISFWLMR